MPFVRNSVRNVRLRCWRFLRQGIPRDAPPETRRCYQALRLAFPLHFLATFPYAFLFAFYHAWLLSLLVLPLCGAFVLGFYLSLRGHWNAARFLVLVPVALFIGVFCLLLGESSRLETTLFYGLTAPFLFFPVGEVRKLAISIGFPSLVWVFLHAWGYGHFHPYPLSHLEILLFQSCIAPTTAMLLLVPLFFLLRAQADSEKRLGETAVKAQASSQAKSEFLAMVSHELRTPLNGLIGSLDLFEATPERERPELLDRARRSGQLLRTIIGDILDISRLEKGIVTLHPQPVRPEALLRHVCGLLEPAAREKSLGLRLTVDPGVPRVMVDPERFQQIAINLLGNAVKFTPNGAVEVHLEAKAEKGLVELVLEIADTGIGIPEDRIGDLFQPFVQAHRGLRANAEGCGLGLSICRQLARSMHGDIEVSSVVGVGSSFVVRLTVPEAEPEPEPGETTFALRAGLRLDVLQGIALVVDDVKTNRIIACRMVDTLGMDTMEACDGHQAVLLWTRDRHPLVLMDLQMPVLDGFEACRQIRQIERPGDRRTLVVALTANVFDEERHRCLAVGMDGFLEKPVSRQTLLGGLMPLVRKLRPDLLG